VGRSLRPNLGRGVDPPGGASVWGTVEGSSDEKGFLGKMTRQGEEAIGKLAQDLLENPMVSGALSAALETRERAMRAQEVALSALNLPSAGDVERLTRRLRSVSQRLEGVEDALDRVERRVEGLDDTPIEQRLAAIEAAVERIEAVLSERAGSESG
jgi:chromosome segregation ATPase